MKLNKSTIDVLKNFTGINSGIVIDPGNVIQITDEGQSLSGYAIVKDSFPVRICLGNLSQFLSILSTFESPVLNFENKYVNIQEETEPGIYNKYLYTDEEFVDYCTLNLSKLNNEDPIFSFTLLDKVFDSMIRRANVQKLLDFVILSDGEEVTFSAMNEKEPFENKTTMVVGKSDKEFKLVLSEEHIRFMKGNYKVFVNAKKNLVKFALDSNDIELTYYIAAKAN